MKNYNIINIIRNLSFGILILSSLFFVACEDDNDGTYKMTKGLPEVYYVRLSNPDLADSLLIGAFMEQSICLIGNNLTSIQEVYFNDQKAVLNQNFITSEVLMVTVPKTIPEDVTNKIYMVTENKDTVDYNFKVLVPSPIIGSMKCEYVIDGDIAVINGDYFLDDPNIPLKVVFAGNVQANDIISITKNEIQVRVPEGSQEGPVTITSLYGSGRSSFYFRDSRGIFLDMDRTTAAGSWNPGNYANTNPDGIDGNYQLFEGTLKSWGTWSSAFFFHYWGKEDVSTLDPTKSVLKFEFNCLNPWLGIPMFMMFEPEVGPDGRNPYIDDGDFKPAQCHWKPYADTGSYQTDGWITVTIPLTEFKYNTGESENDRKVTTFTGMRSFFMGFWGALPDGIDSNDIKMCVDNIRIVPTE